MDSLLFHKERDNGRVTAMTKHADTNACACISVRAHVIVRVGTV